MNEVETYLDEQSNSYLASMLEDIWIEEDLSPNDLDHDDMVCEILEWVKAGVKRKSWTYKSWLESVR